MGTEHALLSVCPGPGAGGGDVVGASSRLLCGVCFTTTKPKPNTEMLVFLPRANECLLEASRERFPRTHSYHVYYSVLFV